MKTVNVLWTGGWDSTFRILQLSTKEVIIQPYYVKDDRSTVKKELETIDSLTEEIRSLASTKCTLCNLIIVEASDVIKDKEISQAYKNLKKDFYKRTKLLIGNQYEGLGRFSKNIKNLELGIEKDSRPIDIMKIYGDIQKVIDDETGDYYILNKSISQDNVIKVFGNYHFPLLDYTKIGMKEEAENKGHIDVMNKTWFCHSPVDNQPCGKCNPCVQTIEAGFKYRFSDAALRRYKLEKQFVRPIKKTLFFRIPFKIYRMLKT